MGKLVFHEPCHSPVFCPGSLTGQPWQVHLIYHLPGLKAFLPQEQAQPTTAFTLTLHCTTWFPGRTWIFFFSRQENT